MAKQNSLHSGDVDRLEDSINDLKIATEQMVESFSLLKTQTTGMFDEVSTLQSDMSSDRSSLQTNLDMLSRLEEAIDTYISEIYDQKIGSLRKRQQNEFLQSNLSTFESIQKSLKSIKSNLEDQKKHHGRQSQVIKKLQYDWVKEKSEVDKHNKSIQSLILAARESLLVVTAESIGRAIAEARKAIRRRMRWLWVFMCLVIIVAIIWMIFGPILSAKLIAGSGQEVSNLSGWEYLLLSRISLPAVLSAPYFLIKRSLDSTSEEARLYQHKEVMLKTLIVFRDSLDEEDQASKNETITKMIKAISIPPSSKMTEEVE